MESVKPQGHSNKRAPYVEDFANALESLLHRIGPEKQRCPLRGGLYNRTFTMFRKLAPYVEDFATTLGSLFRVTPHWAGKTNLPLTWRTLRPLWEAYSGIPQPHGWDGNSELPLSKRAYRGFAHGETALASHTGKPWTKFPDVPETGNVRDNNNNNNKRRGLGQGRAPPLLAQNAHRVADKTVFSIIYLV